MLGELGGEAGFKHIAMEMSWQKIQTRLIKNRTLGVPTVVQWLKNPTVALGLLWRLRFNPWPRAMG